MRLNFLRSCHIAFWIMWTGFCFAQNSSMDGLKELLKSHPAKDSIFTEFAQANKQMGALWQTIQPSESIEYFKQSLEAFKETGNKEEVVNLHQMMATAYCCMNDYDNQLLHLKKALQDALALNDAKLEINIMYQIMKTYCSLNNYDQAMEYCLMILRESLDHDQWLMDEILMGQAEIEFQKGNYQTSMKLNEKVLAHISEKEQKQLEMTCLCNVASCLIKMNRYNYARMILKKCMAVSHPDDDDFDNSRVLQLMIELDSKTGNIVDAYRRQRQLEQLTAKKQSLEQVQKSLDSVMQAEMQQLNSKLTYLQSIYLKQNNQTAKTNTILIVLIVVACGGSFFIILLMHSFKKLKFEKLRFTDDQTMIVEKQNNLSAKFQSLLQKKDSLQEINNNLSASNRSKTELFKAISHDLQTPLIQLQQNLTDLMKDISEDQFRQSTSGLTSMVGDISLLLENLLQWSKYQSQGIYTKLQYTEVTALVNDIIDHQKYSAAEKKITISNVLEQKIFIYADEEMVKSLLKAILQNIVKLSELDASITISGNKDKKNGWLQVNYTGQMPLKQTFLQHSQVVNYGSETTELGKAITLGWMLCRILAKANNGTISVEDNSTESFQIILNFPLEKKQV